MNVIIIGCGRAGSTLAAQLAAEQHDVCVLDRDQETRDLLPSAFAGRFLVGNGYHREPPARAGITHADALVAVTSGDNTNIVAARVARNRYRVPKVIARIYDPRRADIYRDLGILTVASVRWTSTRIHRMLAHRDLHPDVVFGNGEVVLVRETVPDWLTGRGFGELEVDREIRVIAVTRGGRAFVPSPDAVVEPGDLVSFAVATTSLARLRSFLDKELGT